MGCKRLTIVYPEEESTAKKARTEKATTPADPSSSPTLDGLPNELIAFILLKVAAHAAAPHDFLACRLASSHLRRISSQPDILASLPSPALACPAKNSSPAYRSFLLACAAAGNAEAAYLLGMIEFYCLERVSSGMKRLVQAAKAGHAAALYSLSVIHFNGSGLPDGGAERGSSAERDGGAQKDGAAAGEDAGRRKLRGSRKVGMGMLLCVAAAKAGHPDALRELGLCLQDGFGIKRSVAQGRLLLVEANLRELAGSGDDLAVAVAAESASSEGVETARNHADSADIQKTKQENVCGGVGGVFGRALTGVKTMPGCAESGGLGLSLGTESAAIETLLQCTSRLLLRASRVTVTGGEKQAVDLTGEERLLARAVLADGGILGCCTGEGKEVQMHAPPIPPVNRFLLEWMAVHGQECQENGRHLCGNARCGRVELRKGEFRCCAACEEVRYCSRACQVVDWRFGHVATCQPCSRE